MYIYTNLNDILGYLFLYNIFTHVHVADEDAQTKNTYTHTHTHTHSRTRTCTRGTVGTFVRFYCLVSAGMLLP